MASRRKLAGVSVSGEVTPGRPSRGGKGSPVAARLPKSPSEQQYTMMAGAMSNAVDELRTFHETLRRAREVSGGRQIILMGSEAQAMIEVISNVTNTLRLGLKARIRRTGGM
jgi:hypothetical protein